ncbi:MAG: hypothetical protein N2Z76_06510 [Treponemataceae bacterium]|nr:hypothetical protein [Treponemataceae bacterium]
MTGVQKVAMSFLIATLLGTLFAAMAFIGIFDTIETRFYNPRITKNIRAQVTLDAETVDLYITELEQRFARFVKEGALRRSFLTNQNREDILERERLSNTLMEITPGLQSIRCIDSNGKRIHYSTLKEDILRQDAQSIAYKNYGDNERDVPYGHIHRTAEDPPLFSFDGTSDRIFIAYPFFDDLEVYKGTILFTLSSRGLVEHLVKRGRLTIGEDIALIGTPAGIITLFPQNAQPNLSESVQTAWSQGILGPVPLVSGNSESRFVLISVKSGRGFFVGRIVPLQFFELPWLFKGIVLFSFYFTVFLIVLMVLNLRQDNLSLIYQRLKRLQLSLLQEYIEKKQEIDWNRWLQELEQRRDEIRIEVTRGLKKKKGKSLDIDTLIDKSWDEILIALGAKKEQPPTNIWDEKKLQEIFERVLASKLPLYLTATRASSIAPVPQREIVPETTLAPLNKTEEEPYQTSEVLDIETVEELTPLEEVPETTSQTEITGVESPGAVTPVEDIETLEEITPIEEAPDEGLGALPPKEKGEIQGKTEDVGLLEVVEELEGLEEVAPVEELEELPPEEEKALSEEMKTVALEDHEATAVRKVGVMEELPGEDSPPVLGSIKEGKHTSFTILKPDPVDTISRSIEFSTQQQESPSLGTSFFSDFSIEVESPFQTLFSDLKISAMDILKPEGEEQKTEGITPELSLIPEEELPSLEETTTEEEAHLEDLGTAVGGDILFSPFLVKPSEIPLLPPVDQEQGKEKEAEAPNQDEALLEELEEIPSVDPVSGSSSVLDETRLFPVTEQQESKHTETQLPVIEEKEGVSYISSQIFSGSEPLPPLDPELKELVDTVLRSPAQKQTL